VNAASPAAVTAANPWRSIEFSLAPIADVSEPVSSTLPAGVATFSVADTMPTAVLAPTAKFSQPEAVAADVYVPPAAAYFTLGVTTAARAEAASADVTVATAASANLSTAETMAADLPVPVDTAPSSSAGMAIAEAAAADIRFKTAASANLATAEAAVADFRGECARLILHQFIYDMNFIINESTYSLLF
jgi:hypothetical protein